MRNLVSNKLNSTPATILYDVKLNVFAHLSYTLTCTVFFRDVVHLPCQCKSIYQRPLFYFSRYCRYQQIKKWAGRCRESTLDSAFGLFKGAGSRDITQLFWLKWIFLDLIKDQLFTWFFDDLWYLPFSPWLSWKHIWEKILIEITNYIWHFPIIF